MRLAAALIATSLAAGCTLLQQTHVAPDQDAAVLKSGAWGKVYRGGYVRILSVNGQAPPLANRNEMALRGGEQAVDFQVLLCQEDAGHCQPIAAASLSFSAEPGHTYLVRAREAVNGSNDFTVWVEDARDGSSATP
jgi:hypothetical protein